MQFNFSGAIIIRDKKQNIDEYCFAFESRRRRSYVEDSPCATRHTYRSNKASQESARKCNNERSTFTSSWRQTRERERPRWRNFGTPKANAEGQCPGETCGRFR